ncbi:MAG: carbon-nitrogen hydrolase family protein [Gemmatimonadetes bacterium]|jgi:predicted amidohydrolase|nr:carbon-nitrogen hydrolase family protein [Gemmatimonadota bacterium]MBT7860217.1 carbon-nitrogen hydrolase family protein [Gemmatimonadota bacterium]
MDDLQLLPDASSQGNWQQWTPMESLAPTFLQGDGVLGLAGGGNSHCFGAWCQTIRVTEGEVCRLRVTVRVEADLDLGLHVTPHVLWRPGTQPDSHCATDTIESFKRVGDRLAGEGTFVVPAGCDAAEIRLLLRYAPQARVWFEEVLWTRGTLAPPRPVHLGTVRGCPPSPANAEEHLAWYGRQIDRLIPAGPDLILLPEFANTASMPDAAGADLLDRAERLPGDFCHMLGERAREGNCYMAAGLLERDGDIVYNSAVLLDRQGDLVHVQRKVHPYWPEEPAGVVPGESFEIFETDFGRVGFMICYDSWWPEAARLLALKGAELVLFPNAGYEPLILPARAIDNNVHILTASLYSPAAITNTVGETLARSTQDGVLTAKVDLQNRPKCHPNAGGNLNPGPGGARWARNARSSRVYEEILACLSKWPD